MALSESGLYAPDAACNGPAGESLPTNKRTGQYGLWCATALPCELIEEDAKRKLDSARWH